jgi:hypothetical protein
MSWLALYCKELRLTRTKFLFNIVFLMMVAVLFFFLIDRYSAFFITLTVPLILVHLFYMFFAMLDSLRQEWKHKTSVFWLNIPTSGWKLLSAKFAAAMTQLLVSLLATFLIIYYLLKHSATIFSDPTVPYLLIEQYEQFWWIFFIGIFIASLQSGVVATFIYMMAKSVRKFGWLLGIVISFASGWLWVKFQQTFIYKSLTEWGVVLHEAELMESFYFHFDSLGSEPSLDMEIANDVILYVGTSIVDLILVVVVLYISAWLLDHKVEA